MPVTSSHIKRCAGAARSGTAAAKEHWPGKRIIERVSVTFSVTFRREGDKFHVPSQINLRLGTMSVIQSSR